MYNSGIQKSSTFENKQNQLHHCNSRSILCIIVLMVIMAITFNTISHMVITISSMAALSLTPWGLISVREVKRRLSYRCWRCILQTCRPAGAACPSNTEDCEPSGTSVTNRLWIIRHMLINSMTDASQYRSLLVGLILTASNSVFKPNYFRGLNRGAPARYEASDKKACYQW